KLPKLGGARERDASHDFDPPTTQVRASADAATYDPLAAPSLVEQMRAAIAETKMPKKVPVIGHLPIVRQFQILGVLLVAFVVLAVLVMLLDAKTASQATASTATAIEMQMLSQRLARGTTLASQGQAAAFSAIKDSRDRFKMNLDALQRGGTIKGVAVDVSDDESASGILKDIKARWDRVDANTERLLDNRQNLTDLAKGNAAIAQGVGRIVELAQIAGGDAANQLAGLSQRIAKNAAAIVASAEVDPELSSMLAKDATSFRDVQGAMARPGASRGDGATLAELARRAGAFDAGVSAVTLNMGRLVSAKQVARSVNNDAEALLADTTRLADVYEGSGRSRVPLWFAIIFALLALGTLLLLGKVFLDDARVRAFESEDENKRNQEAILRLLNEMGNLADGDLTVQASVTEDVTGAIADSINFTIEELRTLVKGINSATDQVTKATQEAQAISNRLFEASQRQNREIHDASASVLTMAHSINEVSQSAAQSAKVAHQSLAAAEKGAQSVQNQISGMNEIRAQIQDTSKRIKRLGESSLEIGEIVELISDLTEQTNILALNAAIQAASAGEAGRGFTVVAEEVQRLAERSGEATKQIEAIVKTIQADTQDAVAAMEKSTVGVVEGTKLSDTAGGALEEIRRVSRELAELIGSISTQTQKQSASVTDVTHGMQGILQITEETTEGTKQTNVSIGQLTKLAAELRSSVAGFKV
ncbi:MAG TPA: methyl-accepting chemotaxis protein, partial [Casimicrobiaceae bacterium]|nr:methyl-accepting chemotaxis protein [Casimicrobiaceae bacterium]